MSEQTEQFVSLVQDIWSATLGLEAMATSAEGTGDDGRADIGARIDVLDSDSDSVGLDCSREMATAAAAHMFQMADKDVTEADLLDAVGELTNIIAGNVRSLFSCWAGLGPPSTVVDEALVTGALVGHVDWVSFDCNGMPFRVFLQKTEGGI